MALIEEILSSITMVFPLPAFWMTIISFLDKCLKALNSDAVKFSDGLGSLEKLSYEDKALSSNLAFIKDKSSLHKRKCADVKTNGSKIIKYKFFFYIRLVIIQ